MINRKLWQSLRADLARHGGLRHGGFWALAVHRLGRRSSQRPTAAGRWLTSKVYGVANVGVDIFGGVYLDRRTELGADFRFLSTGMIFFHPGVKIGDRVDIMHGVTIGTNMGSGVPTIGNDVFIGCNTSVLGDLTIGDGARIAPNSLVIADVRAGALVGGVPARSMTASAFAKIDPRVVVGPAAPEPPLRVVPALTVAQPAVAQVPVSPLQEKLEQR